MSRHPSLIGGCSGQLHWSCRTAAWRPAARSLGPDPGHTWWCGMCSADEWFHLGCRSCHHLPCWRSDFCSPLVWYQKALGYSHFPTSQTLKKGEKWAKSTFIHLLVTRGKNCSLHEQLQTCSSLSNATWWMLWGLKAGQIHELLVYCDNTK